MRVEVALYTVDLLFSLSPIQIHRRYRVTFSLEVELCIFQSNEISVPVPMHDWYVLLAFCRILLIEASSSSVSLMPAAEVFSMTREILVEPGMGMTYNVSHRTISRLISEGSRMRGGWRCDIPSWNIEGYKPEPVALP